MKTWLMIVLCAAPSLSWADDATDYYDVTTQGTTTQLKAQDKGLVSLGFVLKKGAHLSNEAPMKIELSGAEVKLEKSVLTLADRSPTDPPTFSTSFTSQRKGATAITAKMTFFVCTDTRCMRQTKTLSLPVEVQ